MSLSLAKNVIVARADNHPPMLDKTNYNSWAIRMLLYLKGKEHGKLLVDFVLNGPFQYETIIELGNETTPTTVRARIYTDLIDEEKIHESVDIKATNIVLQGLPQDIYKLVNHKKSRFRIESNYSFKLINDMHTIGMEMKPLQVNTKFVNHLQPEWSKFVTDVKLEKDMHTTNFGHLYAHLRQHEAHGVNNQGAASQARVVKCYNYQEEGHFARQCTQPKRPKNLTWFKKKMSLTEALESGAYLDPEQLAFLADNGDTVIPTQASQEILTLAAFQTNDLDAFDFDYDDVPSAKAVLMANLSSYDSDIRSKVPFHDPNIENDMSYQSGATGHCVIEQTSLIMTPKLT
ncbi:retrovirus-related pol polyprotein from transposon TNT 1-94 [Tanacetum coccineum]